MRTPGSAAVVGGGPAGLMAAEVLATGGLSVTVFDRMPSLGRKLLMAGRGGLNLTHSEPLPQVLGRYRPDAAVVRQAIEQFTPQRLRDWCAGLGQDTFVGSSGRVFPTALKASPLLRAWLRRLAALGVAFAPRHRWVGWTIDGQLRFETPGGERRVAPPDVTVLATGGASWPNLGSDGAWAGPVADAGIAVAPFRPANSGVTVSWTPSFRDRFEGQPLKNVALRFRGRTARGDAVVTRTGLEGGAVYALSADLRDATEVENTATLIVDLRPDLAEAALASRLGQRVRSQSLASTLRKSLHLSPVAAGLLHEAVLARGQVLANLEPDPLAALIRSVPVTVTGVSGLARAISSAGGLRFDSLGQGLMLRARPGVFAAGEMLDWEAPTGGYLLQACFATGAAAAGQALRWLAQETQAR